MNRGVSYLRIENCGQSVARDVSVTFDPPMPSYEKTSDGQPGVVAPMIRKRYDRPISMIAPRHGMKNIYSYVQVGHDGNVEPVPESFTVAVRYTDDHQRSYSDSFHLDLGNLKFETQSNPGDGNDPEIRQNKALEAIAWELWD